MFSQKLGIAAAVLAGVGSMGLGLAAGQSPSVARRPTPAAERVSAGLSPYAAEMYTFVKRKRPTDFKWQRIPWLTDLPDGVRQARAENRPLLIWSTTDAPLERC